MLSRRCLSLVLAAAGFAALLPWAGAVGTAADPPADSPTAQAPAGETDLQSNPYLAQEGLSAAELVKFIDKMQSKPATIRARPGYVEAMLDACRRVLEAGADESLTAVAVLARFETLHFVACRGDPKADEALFSFSAEMKDSPHAAIAREARFHLLEQRAAAADQLPPDQLPALLDEIKIFLAEETLTGRHRRLASGTVHVINLLPDKEAAQGRYVEFGALFARSSDRKLARYGKQVAETASEPADLVGQTLEVAGTTVDGRPFDWASYRGKVVLVDFWATWCGPCRAELPNVLENYQRYHDQGFEVVGISLDEDRGDLEEFLRENPLPWVTLFDDTTKGWENPVAARYGVRAIPFPVLVDRQGKVVSVQARGEELTRLLAQLVAADGARPPDDKAPQP